MLEFLIGLDDSSMIEWKETQKIIHRDIKLPLLQLVEAAEKEGIQIELISGFRDFATQLTIWNNKCLGKRAILDDDNNIIDPKTLNEWELIQKIMRFSAIPGASRHHWGVDLDIIDRASLPSPDYEVQLTPDEFSATGPFAKLSGWMNENLEEFGFEHPYLQDTGGVSPEAWHISYAPLSTRYSELYDFDFFWKFLNSEAATKILLIESLKDHAEEIFERFIV